MGERRPCDASRCGTVPIFKRAVSVAQSDRAGIARAVRDWHCISRTRHARGFDSSPAPRGRPHVARNLYRHADSISDRRHCEKNSTAQSANIMTTMTVRLGSEKLLASGVLKHKKVGIVSNPASVDAHFKHIVRAIAE